jgi:hypothetical protein
LNPTCWRIGIQLCRKGVMMALNGPCPFPIDEAEARMLRKMQAAPHEGCIFSVGGKLNPETRWIKTSTLVFQTAPESLMLILFGKLSFAVTPFLRNSFETGRSSLSGNIFTEIGLRLLGVGNANICCHIQSMIIDRFGQQAFSDEYGLHRYRRDRRRP